MLLVLGGHLLGQAGHTRAMLTALVGPIATSTLLVFALGIYLVHHPALVRAGLADARYRAVAVDLGWAGSLFAILFFNYHRLHHAHPQLTWVQLGVHRRAEADRLSLGTAWRASRAVWTPSASRRRAGVDGD